MRALKISHSITSRDERSIEKYLSEISHYDVLTPDEEYRLFKQYKNGDESVLTKIVQHNLRFVVSVAKQYNHLGLRLGDLINEGNIGLIKAARRFDESRGFKFISYAVWWIRQSILQAINDKGRKIRLPHNVSNKTSSVMANFVEILQKEEREPTMEELVKATGFNAATVNKCLETYEKCRSLDAPINADGDASLINIIADTGSKGADYEVAVKESQQIEVRELLQSLPPRQATVLSMYFGIGRNHPLNLSDVAEFIGVSKERARQIRDRALRKLRIRARHLTPTFSTN